MGWSPKFVTSVVSLKKLFIFRLKIRRKFYLLLLQNILCICVYNKSCEFLYSIKILHLHIALHKTLHWSCFHNLSHLETIISLFWLTLSIPLWQIGSKLHSSSIPRSIFVTRKHRSLCPRSAEWHDGHLGGNHYVNTALIWQCCLLSYHKGRARGFKPSPCSWSWKPMRDNIFWKKSSMIAGQTNLPQKTVMRSISQPYLHRKSRISGLDGVQYVPRTTNVSDRPCNLQNTPDVLKIAVSSHQSKSSNCTFVKQCGNWW